VPSCGDPLVGAVGVEVKSSFLSQAPNSSIGGVVHVDDLHETDGPSRKFRMVGEVAAIFTPCAFWASMADLDRAESSTQTIRRRSLKDIAVFLLACA
jgi:hypothetical protein